MTLQEWCDFITSNFYDDYQGRIILKNKNKVLNVKGLKYMEWKNLLKLTIPCFLLMI